MAVNSSDGDKMEKQDARKSDTCPLISVGMPVYNGSKYIALSIQSILDQTLDNFELIISDNASDDSTEEICREFARLDERIRYYRNEENIGAARNYKRLLDLSRGEYFRWSNSDDLIAPDLHELCLQALEQNPNAVLSYGNTEIIDESGTKIRCYDDDLNLQQPSACERFRCFFDQVGLTNVIYGLMRTDAVRQTRVFGDGTLPAADVSFMAELTLHGTFVEVPKILFYRRMHSEASSFDRSDDERQANFWQASPTPFKMPTLRQSWRYMCINWATKLQLTEKLKLSAFILRRMVSQRSKISSELVGLFRRR